MNSVKIITILVAVILLSAFAKRDPTRPPGMSSFQTSEVPQKKKLKLQGLITGDSAWVIINDMVIKQGETKKGIKIVQIKANKVLVSYHQKRQWLKWQSMEIKNSLTKSSNK